MAFGDDPSNERFRRDYIEERDGQLFLRPPKGAQVPMPISYELYLELLDAHETEVRIAKAVAVVCTISGLLFGAYRWALSDDLLQIFVFTGIGLVAGLIGSFAMAVHGSTRMGRIYLARAKAQDATQSARASDDALF